MTPMEKLCETRISELKAQIREFSGDKGTLGYVGLKQDLRAAQDFLQSLRIEG